MTTQSVEYDALVIAGGSGAATLGRDPYTALNLGEAFLHYKPIGAWSEGREVLEDCGIPSDSPGVVRSSSASRAFAKDLIDASSWHRHWDRPPLQS
jgi:catalase